MEGADKHRERMSAPDLLIQLRLDEQLQRGYCLMLLVLGGIMIEGGHTSSEASADLT